jgi:hypothetical protein
MLSLCLNDATIRIQSHDYARVEQVVEEGKISNLYVDSFSEIHKTQESDVTKTNSTRFLEKQIQNYLNMLAQH